MMSAWSFLPVLLLLHQVAGHFLPVPQEQDGDGPNGGSQNGGCHEEGDQNGGDQDKDGQYGGGQDRDKHNNHVTMTRINQVNAPVK